jgi:hypothetical protein
LTLSGASCATSVVNIDADGVESALLARKTQIGACQAPGVFGRVGTSFTIGHRGEVTDAKITQSEIKNPTMEACILGEIRKVEFPVPRNGDVIHINYPFRFTDPKESHE